VQQIADLAWAGQHEQAIAAASAALKRKALADDERMTLLDLRSESYIAVGDLKLAAADATTMKALAKREGGAELQARALCREALVQLRQGDARSAELVAAAALKAAERSRQPALIALCISRLSLAQVGARSDLAGGARNAARAAALFASLGDTVRGAAHWVSKATHSGRPIKTARAALQRSAALARAAAICSVKAPPHPPALVEADPRSAFACRAVAAQPTGQQAMWGSARRQPRETLAPLAIRVSDMRAA
jgi:hypothetical protein